MQVATIVPVPHLSLVKDDQYHLCLSHVVSQDSNYRGFYAEQAIQGKFVIIDNGAAEGACQGIDKIIENALSIKATEIVLPDEIYDMKTTLEMSEGALAYAQGFNFSIMVVPQGETFEEWCECAKIMMEWPIHTIGISKFCTPKYGKKARLKAAKFLESLGRPVDIHLLGCWDFPIEIGEVVSMMQDSITPIRGTDSAIAFVYATSDLDLDPRIERPELEVDFLAGTAPADLMSVNKQRWTSFCTTPV